jgi:hypothetical protein
VIYEKKMTDPLHLVGRRHGMKIQNLPLHTTEGKQLRALFFPQPQHPLITADFSSLELRVWAELSRASAQKGK